MSTADFQLDPRTKCFLKGLEYDFTTRMGELLMGEGSCTDMSGCIAIFTQIDPDVEIIRTWRCGKTSRIEDTAYRKWDDKWHAIPSPRDTWSTRPD